MIHCDDVCMTQLRLSHKELQQQGIKGKKCGIASVDRVTFTVNINFTHPLMTITWVRESIQMDRRIKEIGYNPIFDFYSGWKFSCI